MIWVWFCMQCGCGIHMFECVCLTSPHAVPASFSLQVQIRPWLVADSYYHHKNSHAMDCRNAVFVGGVPRPLKASELAEEITEKYGCVMFAAIDCDADLKYPKGMLKF